MFDLTGMTALVTGASGGIGSAISQALVRQGARVALSATRQEALDELQARIGGDTITVPANLANLHEADTLVPTVVDRLGRLDILVGNAGCTRDNISMRMINDEWDQVLRVNLEANFRLARAALRAMVRARHGRVIFIGSVVGSAGNGGQANYAASKGGLVAMSKALAQEVARRGITVNCVAPGLIASPMTKNMSDAQRVAAVGLIPIGRIGTGDEVAAAVLFFASREASYVTGQTIHVNGGMAMP